MTNVSKARNYKICDLTFKNYAKKTRKLILEIVTIFFFGHCKKIKHCKLKIKN